MKLRPDESNFETTLTACIWSPQYVMACMPFLAPFVGCPGQSGPRLARVQCRDALQVTARKRIGLDFTVRRSFWIPDLSPVHPATGEYFSSPYYDSPVTDTDCLTGYIFADGRALSSSTTTRTRHRRTMAGGTAVYAGQAGAGMAPCLYL